MDSGNEQQTAAVIIPAGSRQVVGVGNGVQFGDLRVGRGAQLKRGDVVVMHVRALLPDRKRPEDTILFDTREKNSPLLHRLGDADASYLFANKAGPRPMVTVGLEDAMVASGDEAMHEGGVRKVLVPANLAYGTSGMR